MEMEALSPAALGSQGSTSRMCVPLTSGGFPFSSSHLLPRDPAPGSREPQFPHHRRHDGPLPAQHTCQHPGPGLLTDKSSSQLPVSCCLPLSGSTAGDWATGPR